VTAEIAIVNRTGIALAADSAVTVGRERVWKNSNKLFHLAPSTDVAIMVFGNGSHCGLPWEVVIKQYRKKLGRKKFDILTEYTQDFLKFLDELTSPHPLQSDVNTYVIMLQIIDEAKETIKSTKGKTAKKKKFIAVMNEMVKQFEEKPIIFDEYDRAKFSHKHSQDIRGFLEQQLDILISKPVLSAMITACFEACRRALPSGAETGVVFAGFGEAELLPVVQELCIDGQLDEKVRAWTVRTRNMNETDSGGMVIPFAQSDIAHLFIEGLLPDYLDFVARTMKGTLDRKSRELVKDYVPEAEKLVEEARQLKANEAMTEKFQEQFTKFRRKAFVQPMMKVVNSLPKEEMAAVAEALVETTSLRRKMDSRLETVGGPVDVAIISKSDGFVWIKRKHYFDIELNRDFVQRRDQRYSGEE
jgi:ATP-dependent protease HslVU (ClpYQ) peptidase subunit